MMRPVVLFSFFSVLNCTSALCKERLLFEIGKRDRSVEPYYELGSSRYPKISIRLDGKYSRGQIFEIEAPGASAEFKYIRSVRLNGRPITGFRIPISEVLKEEKLLLR